MLSAHTPVAPEVAAVHAYLDDAKAALTYPTDVLTVMRRLIDYLRNVRAAVTTEVWKEQIKPMCLVHPICSMLHEDPYTARAFAKPRGYAGDAVMLDFIYTGMPPAGTTPLGASIFQATTRLENGLSVIERRNRLARLIDETADQREKAKIVALAAGHLPEAGVSRAIQERRIGSLQAMDQDPESLAVVQNQYAELNIQTIHCPIVKFIRSRHLVSNIDFTYAAGLFDYLPDSLAARLSEVMFLTLRSRGKMLVANYVPTSQGRGYMEAFMDWDLIYRDEGTLERLVRSRLRDGDVSACRSYMDSYSNIAYVEVVKC